MLHGLRCQSSILLWFGSADRQLGVEAFCCQETHERRVWRDYGCIEPGLTYYCRTGDGERARAVKIECAQRRRTCGRLLRGFAGASRNGGGGFASCGGIASADGGIRGNGHLQGCGG